MVPPMGALAISCARVINCGAPEVGVAPWRLPHCACSTGCTSQKVTPVPVPPPVALVPPPLPPPVAPLPPPTLPVPPPLATPPSSSTAPTSGPHEKKTTATRERGRQVAWWALDPPPLTPATA